MTQAGQSIEARRATGASDDASRHRLRLWLKLLGVSRGIETELRARLVREFGETLPRFDVLAALHRMGTRMTMSELSRHLRVSNGNVTGIIERLAEDGLVERRRDDQDRRTAHVCLTDGGAAKFETMAEAHHAWVDEILGAVTVEAAAELIARLDPLARKPVKGGGAP